MKTKLTFILFILFMLSLFSGSAKATLTAGELKHYCEGEAAGFIYRSDRPDLLVDEASCLSYFAGWMDATNYSIIESNGEFFRITSPSGFLVSQAVRVFYKYVDSHPAIENKPANKIILLALVEAKLIILTPIDKREVQ